MFRPQIRFLGPLALLTLIALSFFGKARANPTAAEEWSPLLYATEGAHAIQFYNANGKVAWKFPAEMSRDVSLLPNGNILFAYNNEYNSGRNDNPSGVREVTPQGEVVLDYKTTGQVWSCSRLPNGLTLVGAASQGRVLFVDGQGGVVKSFPVRNKPGHSCLRHVRATAQGTILVAEESARSVREYNQEGEMIREIGIGCATFSMERFGNGNTLISGQNQIVEIDPQGKTVWEVKGSDLPEIGVRFLAGFQVFENGDLLVCNAGGKVPLFRLTREATPRVVWKSGPLPLGHGVALCPKNWEPSSEDK